MHIPALLRILQDQGNHQAWEESGILATLCRMGRFGRSGVRGLDPGKDPGPRLGERKVSVVWRLRNQGEMR